MNEKLLPETLKELWKPVEEGQLTHEQFGQQQQSWLEEHRNIWRGALLLDGFNELRESLLNELGAYIGLQDGAEIERRCRVGSRGVEDEWHQKVVSPSGALVERF